MKSRTNKVVSLLICILILVSLICSCKSESPDKTTKSSEDITAEISSSLGQTETKTQSQFETKKEEALDSVHKQENNSVGSYYFTEEEIALNSDKPTKIFDLGVVIYGDIIVPPYIKNVAGINREYIMIPYFSHTCKKGEDAEYRCPPHEDYEKYKKLNFNGSEYEQRSKIEKSEISERAGEAQLIFRMYCDNVQSYDETKTDYVYEIKNVSPEFAVAVKFKSGYYVYVIDYKDFRCNTFGEMARKTNFYENIDLNYFEKLYCNKSNDNAKFQYLKDDTELMNLFKDCEDAKRAEHERYTYTDEDICVKFTLKSDIYRCYLKSDGSSEEIYVYSDGYISTRELFGYMDFFIGKEKAQRIIDYALKNGVRKDLPDEAPVCYRVAGTVTELNNRRIVINDSILCRDKNKGMDFIYEFRSPEEAQGFARNFKVGDNIEFTTFYELSKNKIIKPEYAYKIKFNPLEAEVDVSNAAEETGL